MALSLEDRSIRISFRVRLYIIVLSILYVIYGVLQFYNGIGYQWIPWFGSRINLGVRIDNIYIPNVFPDPFSGLTLIIIGLILVRSIQLYGRSEYVKAMGFLFVGWALGLILMILNVLVIFADVLDAYYPLLWGESVEGWCLANDPWGISPYLILGIFAIPIYWSNAGIKRMLRGIIPK